MHESSVMWRPEDEPDPDKQAAVQLELIASRQTAQEYEKASGGRSSPENPQDTLTAVEYKILDLMSQGLERHEITNLTQLTRGRFNSAFKALTGKLDAETKQESIRIALENDILPPFQPEELDISDESVEDTDNQIVSALYYGLSQKQIANLLQVDNQTAALRTKSVLYKLGTGRRLKAIRIIYSANFKVIKPALQPTGGEESGPRQAGKWAEPGFNAEIAPRRDGIKLGMKISTNWHETYSYKASQALNMLIKSRAINPKQALAGQIINLPSREAAEELYNEVLIPKQQMESRQTDIFGALAFLMLKHLGIRQFLVEERTTGTARKILGEQITKLESGK